VHGLKRFLGGDYACHGKEAKSFEEMKRIIGEAAGKMDDADFANLLAKANFTARAFGRAKG